MDDETKLLFFQLLETVEKVFDLYRPRTLPADEEAFFLQERNIRERIEAIKKKILVKSPVSHKRPEK